jgi:probable HAF family extracellular repeat protein
LFEDSSLTFHGFLKNGATLSTIDVPGATSTQAFGINDSGQIVGAFASSSRTHGFLENGATLSAIDVPGAVFTNARGINDSGQIVGTFQDSSVSLQRGFLATPVPEPGALFLLAAGLMGLGTIAWKRRGKSFL